MLSQVFTAVLLMSVVGSVLFVVLLALKPITKRVFGSHWQYYIWLVVLIVMMLPVRIQLPKKTVQNSKKTFDSMFIQDNNAYVMDQEFVGISNVRENQIITVHDTTPVTIINPYLDKYDLFTYIWVAGMVLFFTIGLFKYGLFIKTLSKNSVQISCPEMTAALKEKKIKKKVCVCVTDCIDAPMVSGLFRPSMWLPNNVLNEKEFHYILMHELTHLKRHDLWYKWFAFVVSSVHWFNPFAYLVVRQINEECEISCDLLVTGNMNREEKNGYMSTILYFISLNKVREQIFTTAMAKDKDQIIRRFSMIKTATKKSKIIMAVSIIAALIILAVALFSSGILNSENIASGDNLTKEKTNILLIGEGVNQKSADTIMLLSFNNVDKSISMLSIPWHTRIENDNNKNLIGNMFGLDNDIAVIGMLQDNLNIPVDYYVKLNTDGLRNIIDILGGVKYEVPFKMVYEDPYQNLYISLESGVQMLDGSKAEQLLRFRKGKLESYSGDTHMARDLTQQSFIRELIKQKVSNGGISDIKKIYSSILQNVETNFPVSEIPQYIDMWKNEEFNDVKTLEMPGEIINDDGITYFLVDYERLNKLTEQYLK